MEVEMRSSSIQVAWDTYMLHLHGPVNAQTAIE